MSTSACLLILALVGTQSLGELAKKEKDRRKAGSERTEAAKVYTDEDLAVPEEDESVPSESEGPSEVAAPESGSSLEEWRATKETEKAAWGERLAEYRARYAEKKERLALLLQVKEQCDNNEMPVGVLDPMSSRNGDVSWGVGPENCAKVPGMISETEKAMHAARDGVRFGCAPAVHPSNPRPGSSRLPRTSEPGEGSCCCSPRSGSTPASAPRSDPPGLPAARERSRRRDRRRR